MAGYDRSEKKEWDADERRFLNFENKRLILLICVNLRPNFWQYHNIGAER